MGDDGRTGVRRRRRWPWATLGAIALVLVAARLAAPALIRGYAQRAIDATPGYAGEVGDVDLHLWRGALSIASLRIDRVGAGEREPFLASGPVAAGLNWGTLLHGRLVATIDITRPELRVPAPKHADTGSDDPKREPVDLEDVRMWQDRIAELMPITIDRLRIHDAAVRVREPQSGAEVGLGEIDAAVDNLSTVRGETATMRVRGTATGGGSIAVDGTARPLEAKPTFSVDLAVRDLDLVALNPLITAFTGMDVERGKLSLFTHLDAAEGAITGYAKPALDRLDVSDFSKDREEHGTGTAIKEAVAGAAAKIVQGHEEGNERQATRIPLKGSLDDPKTSVGKVVAGLLRNAFVQAIRPVPDDDERSGSVSGSGGGDGERGPSHDDALRALERSYREHKDGGSR